MVDVDFRIDLTLKVHLPVTGVTYAGGHGLGAWFYHGDMSRRRLSACPPVLTSPLRVVASRSHLNEATQAFVDALSKQFGDLELISSGSSLKLCRVASGEADLYPRLAPTMEWDTAAAQAVVEAAGGSVLNAGTGLPLGYNKPDLLNPGFIVIRPGFPVEKLPVAWND